MPRIVTLGLFCGVGSKPPYVQQIICSLLYACTVYGGPQARELGRKKNMVSSEHTQEFI